MVRDVVSWLVLGGFRVRWYGLYPSRVEYCLVMLVHNVSKVEMG